MNDEKLAKAQELKKQIKDLQEHIDKVHSRAHCEPYSGSVANHNARYWKRPHVAINATDEGGDSRNHVQLKEEFMLLPMVEYIDLYCAKAQKELDRLQKEYDNL